MLFDQPESLNPDKVIDWHSLCTAGLLHEQKEVAFCIQNSIRVPSFLINALPSYATGSDIDSYFSSCNQEMDLSAILTLIAGAEARIRLDARQRMKGSGPLAMKLAFLSGNARSEWGIPLYENGIMDAWKDQVSLLSLSGLPQADRDRFLTNIGRFKEVLTVRHWVAHGRYWELKRNIGSYPPATVARMVTSLYVALRDVASYGGLAAFA